MIVRMIGAALAMSAAAFVPGASAADHQARPDEGAALARMFCGSCHDVSGKKPATPASRPPDVPPSFFEVAQDTAHTPQWFVSFLRLPHGRMDNVVLSRGDIDKISAYILSMREH